MYSKVQRWILKSPIKKCKVITLKEEDRDKIDFSGRLKMNGEKLAADSLVGKIMLT